MDASYVLNNKSDSQNNACNRTIGPNALRRKVQNSIDDEPKRPTAALTHLQNRPPVDIEFNNLSYTVFEGRKKGTKTILKCANGMFRSGELTAIMGPSGAGKSTLMNILAGYKTSNVNGSVLINGKDRNLRQFRKLSCYIMQDNCLLPHLTVREAMRVSANLKLGKDISSAAKKNIIDEIIETLGLVECANTKTINLSGGQRKRLSIALELVNNPPVMFFDEPTSGLDSSSCFQCTCLLKSLAKGGRTIICTIHQPSARLFEMFDYLYTLAEGQCIYQGKVLNLVPFLSSIGLWCPPNHNPADYMLEVASGDHGDWVDKLVMVVNNKKINNLDQDPQNTTNNHSQALVLANSNNQTNGSNCELNIIAKENINKYSSCNESSASGKLDSAVVEIPHSCKNRKINDEERPIDYLVGGLVPVTCTTSLLYYNETDSQQSIALGFPTSGFKQFWILMKRTFLSIMRDQMMTHLRLLSHAIVGVLIGLIYFNIGSDAAKVTSNAGCIFFTVMFTMFTGMMPTILTFPTEMTVFIKEHLNCWYSLKAFYFAKTLSDLPFQIVFSSVNVLIIYFMTGQPMETDRILMFTTINILTALVAQSLGLLMGAGLSEETGTYLGPVIAIPMVMFSGFFLNFNAIPSYLQWLTYVSYVRYGFEGAMLSVYGFNREKLDCSIDYCHFRSPAKFLKELSMDGANFWVDVGALIVIFVVLRIISYFLLRMKLRMIR